MTILVIEDGNRFHAIRKEHIIGIRTGIVRRTAFFLITTEIIDVDQGTCTSALIKLPTISKIAQEDFEMAKKLATILLLDLEDPHREVIHEWEYTCEVVKDAP